MSADAPRMLRLTPRGLALAWAMNNAGKVAAEMRAFIGQRNSPRDTERVVEAFRELVRDGLIELDDVGRVTWAGINPRSPLAGGAA